MTSCKTYLNKYFSPSVTETFCLWMDSLTLAERDAITASKIEYETKLDEVLIFSVLERLVKAGWLEKRYEVICPNCISAVADFGEPEEAKRFAGHCLDSDCKNWIEPSSSIIKVVYVQKKKFRMKIMTRLSNLHLQ